MTDEMVPGENRLKGIDPEKLMVVEVDEIAPLLDVQYPGLKKRGEELLERAMIWAKDHHVAGQGAVIADDLAMSAASDLFAQLSDYARDNGEVEEARKKVGDRPRRAVNAINAWFGSRRDRLVGAMATITTAQKRRLEVVKEEQASERRRIAQEAEALAAAKLEAARAAHADEATVDEAIAAEDRAEKARAEAAAPMQDMTRTRSALGVTTSASETWTYELDDMMALAKAVVAGTVPLNFLAVNDAIVKASLRGKAGIRSCAGLRIFAETKLNRRGAR
jgi:hypothetical protein